MRAYQERLLEMMSSTDRLTFNPIRPHTAFEMDIIEVPPRIVPKLELGGEGVFSDECRNEFNLWLLERFGTRDESIIPLGVFYMFGNTLLGRPETVCKLTNFS